MGGAEGNTGGVSEDMVLMFCDARYFIGGGAEGSTGWGLRRYGSDVL